MFKVLITRSFSANVSLYNLSSLTAARSVAIPNFGEIARIYDVDNHMIEAYSYVCPLTIKVTV